MTETRRRRAPNVAARRAKGVAMLLGGAKVAEIAAACGVSRRQVQRWTEEPEVREQIERTKAGAQEKLIAAAGEAVDVLLKVMRDPTSSSSDRTRAALAVLDRAGCPAGAKVELTGKGGGALALVVTAEQRNAMARGEFPEGDEDGQE